MSTFTRFIIITALIAAANGIGAFVKDAIDRAYATQGSSQ
jgi:hypothetical protein